MIGSKRSLQSHPNDSKDDNQITMNAWIIKSFMNFAHTNCSRSLFGNAKELSKIHKRYVYMECAVVIVVVFVVGSGGGGGGSSSERVTRQIWLKSK